MHEVTGSTPVTPIAPERPVNIGRNACFLGLFSSSHFSDKWQFKWQFCVAPALYEQNFQPNPVSPMMRHCGTHTAYGPAINRLMPLARRRYANSCRRADSRTKMPQCASGTRSPNPSRASGKQTRGSSFPPETTIAGWNQPGSTFLK